MEHYVVINRGTTINCKLDKYIILVFPNTCQPEIICFFGRISKIITPEMINIAPIH